MIPAIALLACGAVLVVEEVGDIPPEEKEAILEELDASFREAAGVTLPRISAREQAPAGEDVVTVTLFGGPLRIRCIAERTYAHEPGIAPAHAEVDLVRGAHTWRPKLDDLVLRLFPRPTSSAGASVWAPVIHVEEPAPRVARWIFLGAGAAALTAGLVFGISSAGALDDLRARPLAPAEYRDTADRAASYAVAADVSIIAGIICSAAGAYLAFEE